MNTHSLQIKYAVTPLAVPNTVHVCTNSVNVPIQKVKRKRRKRDQFLYMSYTL